MKDFKVTIEAGRSEKQYWKDLWQFRDLFYILAWRDIAVRYKQTVIGILWAVIQPLLTMVIFVVIFGKVAQLPSEGVPYPIFVFAAMLPWQFFATAFNSATNSMVGNASLITKVYFPRLIIPASSIGVAFIDFLVTLGILTVFMAWYQYIPDWKIFFIITLSLLIFMFTFGIGLFFSALNIKFRDFRYTIPFIIRFGLYVSPVGFSSTIIPEKYKMLFYMNPMAFIIDAFRWVISAGKTTLYIEGMYVSLGVILFFLFVGVRYFRKTERVFADVV